MLAYMDQWRMLRGHLSRRVGSRDLAEEALQETWLRLAGMSELPAGCATPTPFCCASPATSPSTLLRRERRTAPAAFMMMCCCRRSPTTRPRPRPMRCIATNCGRWCGRWRSFPPSRARPLLLNRCDGLSHAQIAARLKVSDSMVAKYLAQALRHCRDAFRAL